MRLGESGVRLTGRVTSPLSRLQRPLVSFRAKLLTMRRVDRRITSGLRSAIFGLFNVVRRIADFVRAGTVAAHRLPSTVLELLDR